MFYSQIGQDEFVCNVVKKYLNSKTEFTFLDLGCQHYKDINNTYYLEKECNWRGVALDIDGQWKQEWNNNRPNSVFITADATTVDYSKILHDNNMPKVIDYLSLDLEPPPLTLKALKRLFEYDYIFNIITYETDYYRERDFGIDSLRKPSQDLFKSKGYILIEEGRQDDYYIHSSLLA